ncbi:MAG TPA: hypothetical protein VHZ03_17645 [Trebonia sp.]|nr:hypothetical protein [Trebonia sp.]
MTRQESPERQAVRALAPFPRGRVTADTSVWPTNIDTARKHGRSPAVAWTDPVPDPPEELCTVAGIRRDPRAEQVAFERAPLHDFSACMPTRSPCCSRKPPWSGRRCGWRRGCAARLASSSGGRTSNRTALP